MPRALRPYLALLSARYRVLLQYRLAALAGFCTQLFWGAMRVMIFTAFFAAGGSQPMTLEDTISYVWLGQALLLLLPWNVDREVEQLIRSGNVAYELLRPVDLYSYWLCRVLAQRTAPVFLRCLPMFVVAGLWLGLRPPPSWASAGAFGLALFGAILLSSAITTLATLSVFWTLSGEGLLRLMPALVYLGAGMVLPLPLFPDWAQPLLNILPFRGLMDIPFRLYLGHLPPEAVWELVAFQLAWTLVLVLAGRMMLARGLQRAVIQGG